MAVLNLLPNIVIEQLRRENVVLAGGIIRDVVAGLPVKDIDIFCHSAEQAERLALEASPFVKHTLFAYTVALSLPVQYVYYKDFADSEALVNMFDFRACGASLEWVNYSWAFPSGGWVGHALDGFHEDCSSRTLHFMSQPKDAGKLTALDRALKLARKGWTLSTSEAARIISHFEPSFTPERVHYAFRPGYGGTR